MQKYKSSIPPAVPITTQPQLTPMGDFDFSTAPAHSSSNNRCSVVEATREEAATELTSAAAAAAAQDTIEQAHDAVDTLTSLILTSERNAVSLRSQLALEAIDTIASLNSDRLAHHIASSASDALSMHRVVEARRHGNTLQAKIGAAKQRVGRLDDKFRCAIPNAVSGKSGQQQPQKEEEEEENDECRGQLQQLQQREKERILVGSLKVQAAHATQETNNRSTQLTTLRSALADDRNIAAQKEQTRRSDRRSQLAQLSRLEQEQQGLKEELLEQMRIRKQQDACIAETLQVLQHQHQNFRLSEHEHSRLVGEVSGAQKEVSDVTRSIDAVTDHISAIGNTNTVAVEAIEKDVKEALVSNNVSASSNTNSMSNSRDFDETGVMPRAAAGGAENEKIPFFYSAAADAHERRVAAAAAVVDEKETAAEVQSSSSSFDRLVKNYASLHGVGGTTAATCSFKTPSVPAQLQECFYDYLNADAADEVTTPTTTTTTTGKQNATPPQSRAPSEDGGASHDLAATTETPLPSQKSPRYMMPIVRGTPPPMPPPPSIVAKQTHDEGRKSAEVSSQQLQPQELQHQHHHYEEKEQKGQQQQAAAPSPPSLLDLMGMKVRLMKQLHDAMHIEDYNNNYNSSTASDQHHQQQETQKQEYEATTNQTPSSLRLPQRPHKLANLVEHYTKTRYNTTSLRKEEEEVDSRPQHQQEQHGTNNSAINRTTVIPSTAGRSSNPMFDDLTEYGLPPTATTTTASASPDSSSAAGFVVLGDSQIAECQKVVNARIAQLRLNTAESLSQLKSLQTGM